MKIGKNIISDEKCQVFHNLFARIDQEKNDNFILIKVPLGCNVTYFYPATSFQDSKLILPTEQHNFRR